MDIVRRAPGWNWLALFLLGAVLADWTPWIHLEAGVSGALRPVGTGFPVLNLIWDVGGVPITVLALVAFTARRAGTRERRAVVWMTFFLGALVEVLAKHAIATPTPVPVSEPAWMARLEALLNVGPSAVGMLLHHIMPSVARSAPGRFIRGSYPSGHTFRLSYTAGIGLGPRRRRWVVAVALATGFGVIATGGHFLGDAVGGFSLAMAGLAIARPAK